MSHQAVGWPHWPQLILTHNVIPTGQNERLKEELRL